MPECSLQFGGYLIVGLYDIILPGRKPLAGDILQQKKKKKGRKKWNRNILFGQG